MTDRITWCSERNEYPDDFIAWFEEWYGPLERFDTEREDEVDEYKMRRMFAFRGWDARAHQVFPISILGQR